MARTGRSYAEVERVKRHDEDLRYLREALSMRWWNVRQGDWIGNNTDVNVRRLSYTNKKADPYCTSAPLAIDAIDELELALLSHFALEALPGQTQDCT